MPDGGRPTTAALDPTLSRAAGGVFLLTDSGGTRLRGGQAELEALLGAASWREGRGPAGVDPAAWAELFADPPAGEGAPGAGDFREAALRLEREEGPGLVLRARVGPCPERPELRLVFLRDESALEEGRRRLSRALSQEAEASARLQAAVLVEGPRVEVPGLDYACLTIPSAYVDGDFLDAFPVAPGTLDLLLGDVMGKGMEAAIHGSSIKFALLRALATSLFGRAEPTPVAALCAAAEGSVASHLIRTRSIATLAYARYDAASASLEFVDCGHNPLVHYRAEGGLCRLVKGADMPFGFVPAQRLRSFLLPLRPGDAFLIYSDGLSECPGPEGEAFGEERLMYALRARAGLPAAELARSLAKLGFDFSEAGFADDLSVIAARVIPDDALAEIGTRAPGLRRAEAEGSERILVGPGASPATDRLRDLVESSLSGPQGLPEEERARLVLAAHEALSNVAEHGLEGGEGEVLAEWRLRGGLFSLELSYEGPDYDWLADPGSPAALRAGRGYGLAIIREVFDSVLLCRGRGREKTLVLCRRLPCPMPR